MRTWVSNFVQQPVCMRPLFLVLDFFFFSLYLVAFLVSTLQHSFISIMNTRTQCGQEGVRDDIDNEMIKARESSAREFEKGRWGWQLWRHVFSEPLKRSMSVAEIQSKTRLWMRSCSYTRRKTRPLNLSWHFELSQLQTTNYRLLYLLSRIVAGDLDWFAAIFKNLAISFFCRETQKLGYFLKFCNTRIWRLSPTIRILSFSFQVPWWESDRTKGFRSRLLYAPFPFDPAQNDDNSERSLPSSRRRWMKKWVRVSSSLIDFKWSVSHRHNLGHTLTQPQNLVSRWKDSNILSGTHTWQVSSRHWQRGRPNSEVSGLWQSGARANIVGSKKWREEREEKVGLGAWDRKRCRIGKTGN